MFKLLSVCSSSSTIISLKHGNMPLQRTTTCYHLTFWLHFPIHGQDYQIQSRKTENRTTYCSTSAMPITVHPRTKYNINKDNRYQCLIANRIQFLNKKENVILKINLKCQIWGWSKEGGGTKENSINQNVEWIQMGP